MRSPSKVLVTGADGFIGSHLTEALVRAGYDVRAFLLYNSFNSWGWLDRRAADVKGKFEVFAGDVRDPNGVRTAVHYPIPLNKQPAVADAAIRLPVGDKVSEQVISLPMGTGLTTSEQHHIAHTLSLAAHGASLQ